ARRQRQQQGQSNHGDGERPAHQRPPQSSSRRALIARSSSRSASRSDGIALKKRVRISPRRSRRRAQVSRGGSIAQSSRIQVPPAGGHGARPWRGVGTAGTGNEGGGRPAEAFTGVAGRKPSRLVRARGKPL